MATDLTQTIEDLAQVPLIMEGDAGKVQERPIADVIAADKYAKTQTAQKKPMGGIRFTRVIPSGSI